MISYYDPEIKPRLDDMPGNGKLTSPDIQNEILQIAASLLIRKIKTELHDETDSFYAMLADECKDVSKRELVAVCIRYMHKGMIKERAVDFLETGDMHANAISVKILHVLEPLQLDPKLAPATPKSKLTLLQQMQTKKFVFILVMFNRLFEMSDYATKGLQCSTISVSDCIDLIEGLKENYNTLRKTESDFIKLVTLTDDLMKKHDIINWDVTGSRKRRLPGKFGDSQIESTLGKASPVKDNSNLKNIMNNVLDRQIMELDTRFKADTYVFMKAAAALLPRSSTFGNNELIQPASTHFSICVEDAEHEVFVQQLKRKVTAGITFPSLVEVLDSCPTDIFPQMNRLLRALVTLPITSWTVERVFSTVSRVKTGMRASMNTDRLNSLSLLSFERELTESLDYKDIISVFNTKPRRLLLYPSKKKWSL
ncbi:hypothetical protein JOQ06_014334 [Pogonophryne albipinna]|uniref:HAT C-terminal dimerisation domain-containing protein n=1 Tax=Pogonophryne albipinna TaxID=1090488 RepID=A0AAD6AJE6_9TELE|nr:hypothetical protein JOQ06_014334 [Pogonophryne albipinna]